MKKKNIFRRRGFAIIICLALVLGSTALSVDRTLGKKCRAVSDSFYSGVYNKAWKTNAQSIENQLSKRISAATGLLTVASSDPGAKSEADALRNAISGLQNARTIPEKYLENERLAAAYFSYAEKIEPTVTTARAHQMIDTFTDDFQNAQNLIESSGYNEAVKEFYRSTLDVFPANILRVAVSGDLPALFA